MQTARTTASADAAQFLEQCHAAFASTPVVTHGRSSNCGHAVPTFR
jgi:hypothetical protein